MPYIIRKAEKSDMNSILNLVNELALYEKMPEEVTVIEENYLQNFEENVFDAIVAEHEGQIIGMALYFLSFSTWKGKMMYLEDFVVKPEFRRRGIGQLLFDGIIAEAKKQDCKMMKWQVLDWNESAIEFYKKYNATFDGEWFNVKLFFFE